MFKIFKSDNGVLLHFPVTIEWLFHLSVVILKIKITTDDPHVTIKTPLVII